MKTKRLIVALLSTLIFSGTLMAGETFSKKYNKEYTVTETSYYKLINKFGKVHIETNNSDKLQIEVTVFVEAKNQGAANTIFDKIVITFTQIDTLIQSITNITSTIQNAEFHIDYLVKMPKNLRISLNNSFGDTYIQELTAKSEIEIKYGNLKADRMFFGDSKPRTMIDIAYGRASIDACDWLKLKVSFSELEIGSSEALVIKSKFSKIDINHAISVVADSKYDDPFNIDNVTNFVYTGEYSDVNIGNLLDMAEISAKYSDIDIERIGDKFTKLNISINYGNADIGVVSGSSFQIDAFAQYGSIDYPDEFKLSKSTERTELKLSGTVGADKKTPSIIKIDAKYADIDFKIH